MTRRRAEGGQTSLLIVGFTLVVAMMVVVVVDASAAYLRRQALGSLADGAALAAADALESERVYTDGLGQHAEIDPRLAELLVREHLSAVDAERLFPGLSHDVSVSGDRVVVRVGAPLRLPLPLPGVAEETYVTGTAAAVTAVTG